ncbi:MAG TPA: glycosyltransferase family 87 protein, partial [Alphaproteobacteria bacterium]|nr:glycosyltransferase family 87 protein [Alphaproteobacteria bacterium]
ARRFLGGIAGPVPIFAFPAVLLNIGHGQNGFLSMSCLGGGILMLDNRPVLAGMLFGALAFKPHLALMVPIVLLAARRFKVFFAAGVTALGFAAASYAVFGAGAWHGFLTTSALARKTLEQGLVSAAKMQSSFAAVRLLGGSVVLAYGVQLVVAIAIAAALIALELKRPRAEAAGPALATACLLASPFLLDYDLTILAIPLAWLAREGVRAGFLPWEKIILLIGFCLPLVSRSFALGLGVPLAPFVILLLFAAVMRRGLIAR